MAIVYQHRKPGEVLPFYVGITDTDRQRPYNVVGRAYNNLWTNIYNKYGREVDILIDGCTWEQAKEIEIGLIASYGKLYDGTGILANISNGGEGPVGVIRSEETRQKLRKPKSEEHKQKCKEAKKGEKNPMFGKKGIENPLYGRIGLRGKKHPLFGKCKGNSPNAKIVIVEYNDKEPKKFASKIEAAEFLEIHPDHLSKVISGVRKIYKRFVIQGIVNIYYE